MRGFRVYTGRVPEVSFHGSHSNQGCPGRPRLGWIIFVPFSTGNQPFNNTSTPTTNSPWRRDSPPSIASEGSPSPSSSEHRPTSPEYEEIQPHGNNDAGQADDGGGLQRHDSTAVMDESERRELRKIATAISRRRRDSVATLEGQEASSAFPPTDPTLDPTSQVFDLGKWLKVFSEELQKEGFTFKEAGVAYKDLSVSGTGDALQLQDTVRSWLMAPLHIGEFVQLPQEGEQDHLEPLRRPPHRPRTPHRPWSPRLWLQHPAQDHHWSAARAAARQQVSYSLQRHSPEGHDQGVQGRDYLQPRGTHDPSLQPRLRTAKLT